MRSHEGLKTAALVQHAGGDGMALLEGHDPVKTTLAAVLAVEVAELQEKAFQRLARMIRNEVAQMLNEK